MLLLLSVICVFFFFFFKQKTAYEMRISDWSSDVCSSDLPLPARIWLLRLFVISLGMGLCLFFFVPALTRYVGMSGVIPGAFVLGLLPPALKSEWIPLACLAYLLGQLSIDMVDRKSVVWGTSVAERVYLGGRRIIIKQ